MATFTGCSVLKCSRAGELLWSTGETVEEFAEWMVCSGHHLALRSGVEWATHSDMPNSTTQWLVTGSDLDVRKTECLDDATICIELTSNGREMRIQFTTGKEKFHVILDQDQAAQLSEAIAIMSDESAVPAPGRRDSA